jgi:hypothetical protein
MAIAAKTISQTEEGHQDDSYFIDEYRMCARKKTFLKGFRAQSLGLQIRSTFGIRPDYTSTFVKDSLDPDPERGPTSEIC